MTIGIDIDSTITCTGEKTKECLQKFDATCSDYHLLPQDKYVEFLDKYEEYIHANCDLKPGVKEAFEYFNKMGYQIIIITARNNEHCPNQEEVTTQYFKRHNLKYDKIIFDTPVKGKCAYENSVSIFVDDREKNLDEISEYGIECLHFSSNPNSKYQTFTDWRDIIKYMKSRKE